MHEVLNFLYVGSGSLFFVCLIWTTSPDWTFFLISLYYLLICAHCPSSYSDTVQMMRNLFFQSKWFSHNICTFFFIVFLKLSRSHRLIGELSVFFSYSAYGEDLTEILPMSMNSIHSKSEAAICWSTKLLTDVNPWKMYCSVHMVQEKIMLFSSQENYLTFHDHLTIR
jgi:hypothetical protein